MDHIRSETPAYEMYQDIKTSLITVNLVFNIPWGNVKNFYGFSSCNLHEILSRKRFRWKYAKSSWLKQNI